MSSETPVIHLVELDEELAASLRDLPGADAVIWKSVSTLEEAAAQVARSETWPTYVAITVPSATDLPSGWSAGFRIPDRSIKLLVVVSELGDDETRQLVFSGAGNVVCAPVTRFDVMAHFVDTTYLNCLFPGQLRGPRGESFELEVPSDKTQVPAVIRFVCERLELANAPGDLIRSLLPLVLDEAVTNAMEHGNGWDPAKSVHVGFKLDGEGFEIRVKDQGPGFRREEVADPLQADQLTVEGGRGLFLMEQMMDEVRYEDGGRTVVLRKSLPVPTVVPV